MQQLVLRYPCSWLFTAAILFLSLCPVPETELQDVPLIDKWVHVAMYFGLAAVVWVEYLRSHATFGPKKLVVPVLVFPVFLGGVIELMQACCTTNRSGDWLDFVANTLGVLLAAVPGFVVCRHRFKKKKR